jgi:hypothetical protein
MFQIALHFNPHAIPHPWLVVSTCVKYFRHTHEASPVIMNLTRSCRAHNMHEHMDRPRVRESSMDALQASEYFQNPPEPTPSNIRNQPIFRMTIQVVEIEILRSVSVADVDNYPACPGYAVQPQ